MEMQKLGKLLDKDNVVHCPNCKGTTFVDQGFRILTTTNIGRTTRWENVADTPHVYVCAKDYTAIVNIEGTYYDASEFIGSEEITGYLTNKLDVTREFATPSRR